MNDIAAMLRAHPVAPGSAAIMWLEQSHFVFKTPAGTLIHVDPFLSRTVSPQKHIHPRPFLEPDRAPADAVFLTHDHRDHTDPDTLVPMARTSPACRFLGPRESCERLLALGIEPGRVTAIAEGESMRFDAFCATAVHAENTSEHDATTHLGYVIDLDGLRVYHTGDTRADPDAYADRLRPVRSLAPHVMIVPINEGYNNPGIGGAVRLVELTDPRLVIPCHFDCFVDNTADPAVFTRALPPRWRERVRVLGHGELFAISIADLTDAGGEQRESLRGIGDGSPARAKPRRRR